MVQRGPNLGTLKSPRRSQNGTLSPKTLFTENCWKSGLRSTWKISPFFCSSKYGSQRNSDRAANPFCMRSRYHQKEFVQRLRNRQKCRWNLCSSLWSLSIIAFTLNLLCLPLLKSAPARPLLSIVSIKEIKIPMATWQIDKREPEHRRAARRQLHQPTTQFLTNKGHHHPWRSSILIWWKIGRRVTTMRCYCWAPPLDKSLFFGPKEAYFFVGKRFLFFSHHLVFKRDQMWRSFWNFSIVMSGWQVTSQVTSTLLLWHQIAPCIDL